MLVTMSIRINNNWNYQKCANYHRMIPLTPCHSASVWLAACMNCLQNWKKSCFVVKGTVPAINCNIFFLPYNILWFILLEICEHIQTMSRASVRWQAIVRHAVWSDRTNIRVVSSCRIDMFCACRFNMHIHTLENQYMVSVYRSNWTVYSVWQHDICTSHWQSVANRPLREEDGL